MRKGFFLLSWKKAWIAIVVGFLSIMIHNLFYALFEVEEPVFFFVPFLVIFYLIVSGIYSLIKKKK